MRVEQNWGGNYQYHAKDCLIPENLEAVQALVAGSPRLKVLGSRHSFNDIADTEGIHLSMERINRVLALDDKQHTVTVEGGIRYGELCQFLHDSGFALHNLASLPHITVAGACATATHGSGNTNKNLAAAVRAIEIIKADGEVMACSRGDGTDWLAGAVVGLGALGVVTKLTLDVVPAFDMQQYVYENLAFNQLQDHFETISAAAYSVSLFTDWKSSRFNQVWLKHIAAAGIPDAIDPAVTFYDATLSANNHHPVPGLAADNCSEQCGIVGAWHERLPHFRLDFTPSAGKEMQSEYFVPRKHAYAAIAALDHIKSRISPVLFTSEVRTIAADDLWLSPCYGRDSVGIHFTWKSEQEAVAQVLPQIEEALAPFEARPHWAKLFAMEPSSVHAQYPRLVDFRNLVNICDPNGKFRNAFLEKYVL